MSPYYMSDFTFGIIAGYLITLFLIIIANENGYFDTPKKMKYK